MIIDQGTPNYYSVRLFMKAGSRNSNPFVVVSRGVAAAIWGHRAGRR